MTDIIIYLFSVLYTIFFNTTNANLNISSIMQILKISCKIYCATIYSHNMVTN